MRWLPNETPTETIRSGEPLNILRTSDNERILVSLNKISHAQKILYGENYPSHGLKSPKPTLRPSPLASVFNSFSPATTPFRI